MVAQQKSRKLVLRIEHDPDCECPMTACDGMWTLHSFNRRSIHYTNPDTFFPINIGLRRKMAVGLAFMLDYYEHGLGMYSISGGGPQCQWDTARGAGILIWGNKPDEMGAKTVEDREKDAQSFLDEYNDWMNGNCYYFILEDTDGKTLDSCGGFIGTNYIKEVINEHLEPDDAVMVTGDVEIRGLKCRVVESHDEDE